jgi:Multiubiquitin
VRIYIEMRAYDVDKKVLTGDELWRLHPGYPMSDRLFLERPGLGGDRQIGATTRVRLRAGMRFYYVPPGIFGSGGLVACSKPPSTAHAAMRG